MAVAPHSSNTELRAQQHDDGSYRLAESGRALEPIVFGLAAWGARWAFGEPSADELDPDLLLWWLHRRLDTTGLSRPRFTVFVTFTDHPNRYWIVAREAGWGRAEPRPSPRAGDASGLWLREPVPDGAPLAADGAQAAPRWANTARTRRCA